MNIFRCMRMWMCFAFTCIHALAYDIPHARVQMRMCTCSFASIYWTSVDQLLFMYWPTPCSKYPGQPAIKHWTTWCEKPFLTVRMSGRQLCRRHWYDGDYQKPTGGWRNNRLPDRLTDTQTAGLYWREISGLTPVATATQRFTWTEYSARADQPLIVCVQ